MESAPAPTSEAEPPSLDVFLVKLTDIHVPHLDRLNPTLLDGPGRVAMQALQTSIREVGLIHPLTVRKNPAGDPPYELVVGFHRYIAMQRLNKTEVPVSVVTYTTDLEYEFIKIMENLCRRDLSALELTWSLGRVKEVYQELHPETKHGAHAKTGKPTKHVEQKAVAFIDSMAAVQERSRGSIGQYLTLYNKLRLSNDPERYATLLEKDKLANSKKDLEEFATFSETDQDRIIERMRNSLFSYPQIKKDLNIVLRPSQPVNKNTSQGTVSEKERVLTPSQSAAAEHGASVAQEVIAKTLRKADVIRASMPNDIPQEQQKVVPGTDVKHFYEEGVEHRFVNVGESLTMAQNMIVFVLEKMPGGCRIVQCAEALTDVEKIDVSYEERTEIDVYIRTNLPVKTWKDYMQ